MPSHHEDGKFITWTTGLSNSIWNLTTIKRSNNRSFSLSLYSADFASLKCCILIYVLTIWWPPMTTMNSTCFLWTWLWNNQPSLLAVGFCNPSIHQNILPGGICLTHSLAKSPQQRIVVHTKMAELWSVIKCGGKCCCPLNIQHRHSTLQPVWQILEINRTDWLRCCSTATSQL